jgi:UDP-2-acetamido-3-amino-2,3-dideoxy-glucuronate N-acetyltransferase
MKKENLFYAHETAIIDPGADIGQGTKIWHFSHVMKGAQIGNNVSLGQNIFVGSSAVIGNNCKIQNNVSIYDQVFLKDNVFCGPSVVFTNVYNPRSEINRKNEYKKTIVMSGVTIGANATIVCGVKIGKYAFIGAGSLINKDVKDYALVVGNPGRQIGWMSEYGEKLNLPTLGDGEFICEKSGKKYVLKNNEINVSKI